MADMARIRDGTVLEPFLIMSTSDNCILYYSSAVALILFHPPMWMFKIDRGNSTLRVAEPYYIQVFTQASGMDGALRTRGWRGYSYTQHNLTTPELTIIADVLTMLPKLYI